MCKYAGLHVPEEVALIAGSTDDLMIEMVQPPLSSVDIPLEKIGYEAAASLDILMHGKRVPQLQLLPPLGVAMRQSTDVLAVDEPEIRDALRFIRENANKPIGVPDLLQAVPLSRRMLERQFKKLLGRTPLEEIRRVHIEVAKNLLTNTNLPIPNVANAAGYAWTEHFVTVFRSAVGMTPLAYRKFSQPK